MRSGVSIVERVFTMALSRGPASALTFTLQDNNAQKSGFSLWLPAAAGDLAATTYAGIVRGPLLNLTDASLLRASMSIPFLEDAPAVAPATSEVERKLVLIFNVFGGVGYVKMEIPSPVFGIESPNTNEVDPGNALVAAFVDAVVDGAIGTENGATNQYGSQITGLNRAYVRHRDRRVR